jgi:hypothetical protein
MYLPFNTKVLKSVCSCIYQGNNIVALGGLVVTCLPLDTRFAGSNPQVSVTLVPRPLLTPDARKLCKCKYDVLKSRM